MSIYDPHSRNRNRMTPAQKKFVERQRERQQRYQELDQQVNRTHQRVGIARKVATFLAISSFCVLAGSAIAIFGEFSAMPNQPTSQAALVMNTPLPTTTLQPATWDTSQATSQNDEIGFVVVPDGFWQAPGMAEAYRAGTPVAELVSQYEQYQAPQEQSHNIAQPIAQVQASTPDPRVEQARNDLEIAQIQAQIDAAQAQAAAEQRIAEAKAEQTITRNQVLAERITHILEIVGLIFLVGAGAVFMRLIGLPLIGWLFDGLIDWVGGRVVKLKYWLSEIANAIEIEGEAAAPELPEHIQDLQINSHQSRRRQELEQQYQVQGDLPCTPEEIKAILATWDQTLKANGKGNYTECQRKAFDGKHGGEFYYRTTQVLDRYRPGHNSPTPSGRMEPYFGNTTQ